MVIDCILDRRDAEKYGDFDYNAHDFYFNLLGYNPVSDNITLAMDYGTENDVKRALCDYITRGGYNPLIINYINARTWLENTSEILPFVNILPEEGAEND